MSFKISAKVIVLKPVDGLIIERMDDANIEGMDDANGCISIFMLFLQKLAMDSGKNPHYCAIENVCVVMQICSINFES